MQSSALPGCDNGPIDYNKIEKHMSQFGGGKITMSKTYWDEGIAIIELNNPQKKNAISGKMMVELRNIIKELEDWGDGADLDFARACSTPQDGFYLSSLMMDTLFKLRKLPLVSVTLAHGATIGGGAEIAIQSDFVLACEDIKLGFVQGHMGITTAWGGATRLVQLVGEKRALDLLLSSKILDAQACVEGGLVKKIVSSSGGLNETLLWTKERIKHHRSVVRAYKSIIATASCCNYEESFLTANSRAKQLRSATSRPYSHMLKLRLVSTHFLKQP
ncbi:ethylmalonyl-CoA decarboxylase-like [Cylas formicarius]|uniref:ethylmalonyl-CoA decarboxylase-like n=1 Tax=Cylas formicarius TaxID=197179 RepID=UPI00295835E9|nr:ethylmalonyl-CoA decarboxylase-like [Cylas formicarius]